MRIKIYQLIDPEKANNGIFTPVAEKGIDSSLYKQVYFGDVVGKELDDLCFVLNKDLPLTHQGSRLSSSDVIEVCNEENNPLVQNGFYYYDSCKFNRVPFDSSKCADMEGMRVVYVTPNHTPIEIHINGSLEGMQNAVDGLIEPVYNRDGTIVVCNEEGKLRNMEGNRILDNGAVIVGPFFVCGDDGEDFRSLTDEEVDKYMDRFAEPETISESQIIADSGFTIYGI